MAQSLNKVIDLQATGTSYLSISGKVGKFLVGDQALEFYADRNVEDYIQIPWSSVNQIGANVSGRKVSRHFEVFTDQGKFLFASKDSGKILKIAREKIGNEKVVKLPTLLQIIGRKIKNHEILIVDEVLAVGDAAFQEKCKKRMEEMLSGGTTLLFVSHSIDQVKELCQNVIWIDKGNVRASGKAKDIIPLYEGM